MDIWAVDILLLDSFLLVYCGILMQKFFYGICLGGNVSGTLSMRIFKFNRCAKLFSKVDVSQSHSLTIGGFGTFKGTLKF